MFKDIISYQLAEGKSTDDLHAVAVKVHKDWMQNQDGFLGWEINENADGTFTDIVSWENRAAADVANENMATMPHSAEWMSCYKMETVTSKRATQKFTFDK